MTLHDQIKQAERKVSIARRELLQLLTVAVVMRDGNKCHYCLTETLTSIDAGPLRRTVDHVMPVSFGGKDELSNLVLACASCNSRKGAQVDRSLLCPNCRTLDTPAVYRPTAQEA